jgi:glutamate dehydrogenase/leucine dehydrogenase
VFLSIQEGWRHPGGTSLAGTRVAVQGLGGVGYHLCKHLHQAGAPNTTDRLARVRHTATPAGGTCVG